MIRYVRVIFTDIFVCYVFILRHKVRVEGDIGVCGIAVLGNFSCGISVILIKNCGIAVFSKPAGFGFLTFWSVLKMILQCFTTVFDPFPVSCRLGNASKQV